MQPILYALSASVLKTFSTLSEKQVLAKAEPRAFTSTVSLVLAFASLPLLYLAKDMSISTLAIWVTAACALCSTVSGFSSAYVLKHLDVSESASLFALSPALITLMSVFFLSEQLSPLQVFGIGLSCVGIFILEGHRHAAKQESHVTPLGMDPAHMDVQIPLQMEKPKSKATLYAWLIISLIFFSTTSVLDRYVVYNLGVDPVFFLIVVQFFILFWFLILDFFTDKKGFIDSFDMKVLRRRSFWAHVFFVIVHRVFHMFAIQGIGASLLHTIKQSSVVMTTILGGKIFDEKHLMRRTIACLCVIAGVVLAIL